jgi:hypothetical protein
MRILELSVAHRGHVETPKAQVGNQEDSPAFLRLSFLLGNRLWADRTKRRSVDGPGVVGLLLEPPHVSALPSGQLLLFGSGAFGHHS